MIHLFHRRITFSLALTIGFLTLIIIGSILLSLPFANKVGQTTNYSDALFTATSAVKINGFPFSSCTMSRAGLETMSSPLSSAAEE